MSRSKIEGRILRARTQLLIDKPFFGQLIMRFKFINASKWLPTAATDGRHFYYNEEFLETLTDEELLFVFGHEVLHCVYNHVGPMSRRGERSPNLWNFAGDYVINLELKEQNIGSIPKIPLLLDDQFKGWFTEKVYDYLFEQNQKNKEKLKQMIGAGNFDHHIDNDGSQRDGQGNDANDDRSPCKAEDLPTVLDENDLKELAEKHGYDKTGENGPVPMGRDEQEGLGEEWKNATQQAAKAARDAGDLPGGVRRMLDEISQPKMDWRELIESQLKSLIRSDYTFMNPSRKTWGSDVILPGMDRENTIDIAICIDTSGSICNKMLRDFLGEVQGIMEEFETFKLHLWFFDTKTYTKYIFSSENVSSLSDVGLKIEGGGGTDFMCNWEYMEEENIEPDQLIMFTDGYPCGSWGNPDWCDTLFVIHGDPGIEAPFGMSVYYDRNDLKVDEYA